MNRLLLAVVCIALVSRGFAATGSTGAAVSPTTAAAAPATTAAAAPATTAPAPTPATGTTAAAASPATTAPAPTPATGTTAAAAAPATTAAAAAPATTGIQYLASGSTTVRAWTFVNSTVCAANGTALSSYTFVPQGQSCVQFLSLGSSLTIYAKVPLSSGWLWATLFANDPTCSAGAALTTVPSPVLLQNGACGWFNVTVSGATTTVYLKTSWTAGTILTTSTPVAATTAIAGSGAATTAVAGSGVSSASAGATTAAASSAATTVVGLLPILLSLVAAFLFA